jgi:spermidine/putrescine transport system permease protein
MRISRWTEALLLGPFGLLLIVAVVLPATILVYYSFYRFVLFEPYGPATLGNYTDAVRQQLYRTLTVNTLWIAIPTTLVALVGGYAVAYFMVFGQSRFRGVLFGLVLTALLASYLVRIFAWRTLLGESGIINTFLVKVGIIDAPMEFLLYTRWTTIIAEVNTFLPFSALMFYAALSGVPPELRGAARDLGAGPVQTLRRITLPLTGTTILVTASIVFFLSAGDYITPLLVGGPETLTIGMDIASSFGQAADYGRGAAVSFLLLFGFALVFAVLFATMKAIRLLPRVSK